MRTSIFQTIVYACLIAMVVGSFIMILRLPKPHHKAEPRCLKNHQETRILLMPRQIGKSTVLMPFPMIVTVCDDREKPPSP